MKESLRKIPSVEKIVQALGPSELPRPALVDIARECVAGWRNSGNIPGFEEAVEEVRRAVWRRSAQRLQTVINGAGVIIHTNLGRSPLGKRAMERVASVACYYNNLEYDLEAGERGSRAQSLEKGLATLCEAGAATVVNNCAAALVLILRHFTARRKSVVISRGELVQIGGGFRIPEILEASGARLREVGATNKTSLEDYERAIDEETGLILKVHRSNFSMSGFVESPSTPELSALARARGIPFVEDLGSGAFIPTSEIAGLPHEPTPAEVLSHGVDLVCCSGDKLMGGPQAGIIAGRADWVKKLKAEPFFRAVRCDKLVLGALEATVEAYLSGAQSSEVPILAMIQQPLEILKARGGKLIEALKEVEARFEVQERPAEIGGGTLPGAGIRSVTLAIAPRKMKVDALAAKLRRETPPIVGCIAEGALHLDLRTIFPEQDELVLRSLKKLLAAP